MDKEYSHPALVKEFGYYKGKPFKPRTFGAYDLDSAMNYCNELHHNTNHKNKLQL